jgi:hypothetical protein
MHKALSGGIHSLARSFIKSIIMMSIVFAMATPNSLAADSSEDDADKKQREMIMLNAFHAGGFLPLADSLLSAQSQEIIKKYRSKLSATKLDQLQKQFEYNREQTISSIHQACAISFATYMQDGDEDAIVYAFKAGLGARLKQLSTVTRRIFNKSLSNGNAPKAALEGTIAHLSNIRFVDEEELFGWILPALPATEHQRFVSAMRKSVQACMRQTVLISGRRIQNDLSRFTRRLGR